MTVVVVLKVVQYWVSARLHNVNVKKWEKRFRHAIVELSFGGSCCCWWGWRFGAVIVGVELLVHVNEAFPVAAKMIVPITNPPTAEAKQIGQRAPYKR